MPLPNGTILHDRYYIDTLLGQGGMGAVYYAGDRRLRIPCAVKENLDTHPEAARQFLREAEILARLNHPNLPGITDYFVIEQRQYLVMDFVEGEDLQAILERQDAPLPEDRVIDWISQVCEALAYMHRQMPPVIHRDVKPANIKLTPENRIKLVDFGIAKEHTSPLQQTTMGARAIAPGFSPYEQYGQAPTDARSDVYAVGATLYALLTGQMPIESIQRIGTDRLVPPRQLNPHISVATEKIILKAMAVYPENRYQTVDSLSKALAKEEEEKGSRPLIIGVAGLLVLGVVVVLLFLFLRGMNEADSMTAVVTLPTETSMSLQPTPTAIEELVGRIGTPSNGITNSMFTETPVETSTPTPTEALLTNTPAPSNTPAPTSTPAPSITATPEPVKVVFYLPGAIHLGDEEFDEWPSLTGDCLEIDFSLDGAVTELVLELEAYRAEVESPIYLNDQLAATLPPTGDRFSIEWFERTVQLPTDGLRSGANHMSICTKSIEENPDFQGDIDDYQLRDILLTAYR